MNHNDRLFRIVLLKLTKARLTPPTVIRLLLAWCSLPGLVILGVTSVSAILALGLPNPVAILVAGICLGAALRDVGIAFRTARLWPIHKELFDWQKIEALVKDGADSQGTPNTA